MKPAKSTPFAVGIDIGSIYVKAVLIDADGALVDSLSAAHRGAALTVLREWLDSRAAGLPLAAGVTFSRNDYTRGDSRIPVHDAMRCLVKGTMARVKSPNSIINIGGSSLFLLDLDQRGMPKICVANSLCAAGTGSFLDEQARRLRLDLENMGDFPEIDEPPVIASRCAVFAKSDLIHRQQEGYSREQMWAGLCRGMALTIFQTLYKGRLVRGRISVTGGVSRNREVVRWLMALAPEAEILTDDAGHLVQALGAALFSLDGCASRIPPAELGTELAGLMPSLGRASGEPAAAALSVELSPQCSFEMEEEFTDEAGTEVQVFSWPEPGRTVECHLGIDIGSTSTKAVLMDGCSAVLAAFYRKTTGDPIGATRTLFRAITDLGRARRTPVRVLGCGTTGSGRKMVGIIVGADLIINEIIAHARGALESAPDIETIFEIGGQDAKYIRLRGGEVVDSNMNYVCAAGTGSFVEEQAEKLGYRVSDVGKAVIGVSPPPTADRCTVFMAQDVNTLIEKGYSPEEALAGVMNSVVKNYLFKVVGKRKVSGKTAFMGATARNTGLVAAFERQLKSPVIVSPYCHVMGAYGAALLARERKGEATTSFRGFAVLENPIGLRRETCRLCRNHCTITHATIPGEDVSPSWGYLCGREPGDTRMRVGAGFDPFRKRQRFLNTGLPYHDRSTGKVVGIPFGLTMYSMLPFWKAFFDHVGCRVKVPAGTDEETKAKALGIVNSDFCFPVKALFGHAATLVADRDVDHLLIPYMVANERARGAPDSIFCPWVQADSAAIQAAFREHGIPGDRVLAPVVDFRLSRAALAKALHGTLGGPLKLTLAAVRAALARATEAQKEFEAKCLAEGERVLQELKRDGKPGIVIIGRPYNSCDSGVNVNLPQKISEYGYTVIPLDFLPFESELVAQRYPNLFWNYGQRIVSALLQVAENENLYAVYLSNFSCGPDSFLLSYAEDIMGEKPILVLELDEHGADTGYITRVEAFLDVLARRRTNPPSNARPLTYHDRWKNRRLWVPAMHEIGSRFFAAAFRAYGFDSEVLPNETEESMELGKKLTRGSECLPTAATVGVFVKTLLEKKLDPAREALFMPIGACRFSQYSTCHRIVLNHLGLGGVSILSPSASEAFSGLPWRLRHYLWDAILSADILTKVACRLRPYEVDRGSVDAVLAQQVRLLEEAVERRKPRAAMRDAMAAFAKIRVTDVPKPLVGIVGEIYMRLNAFCNGNLIRAVEEYGGEAWLSPISEMILYQSEYARWYARRYPEKKLAGIPFEAGFFAMKDRFLHSVEEVYAEISGDLLRDRREPDIRDVLRAGMRYVPMAMEGESIVTVGRAVVFIEQGAAMVVNASPFGCMPGTLTAAFTPEIQEQTGIPIVNMFYDDKDRGNNILKTFIETAREIAGL